MPKVVSNQVAFYALDKAMAIIDLVKNKNYGGAYHSLEENKSIFPEKSYLRLLGLIAHQELDDMVLPE